MLGEEDSDDDEFLLPILGQSHQPLPRFRVGSNPTIRRNKLFGTKVKSKSVAHCGDKRIYTRAFDSKDNNTQRSQEPSGPRRRLDDQNVTAPDAVTDDEGVVVTLSPPAIPHVHINVPTNQPKRKATQANLRDYYRSKRTRLD